MCALQLLRLGLQLSSRKGSLRLRLFLELMSWLREVPPGAPRLRGAGSRKGLDMVSPEANGQGTGCPMVFGRNAINREQI